MAQRPNQLRAARSGVAHARRSWSCLVVGYPMLRGLMVASVGFDVPGRWVRDHVRVRGDPGRRVPAQPGLEARPDRLTCPPRASAADCGSDLSADVRWCTRCYAPVTEFAPRERLHEGFVGKPWHDHDDSGHWSRWEKSPTTLGPGARLGGTIFILAWLISGFFYTFVVFWFAELFLEAG